jgi:hypothetical protein
VKPKGIITLIAALLVAAVVHAVATRTFLGRSVLGISTVAVRNDSDTPLRSVIIELADSRRTNITRRFEIVQPHQSVRVRVRTSDLYVHKMSCNQGQRSIAYDDVDIASQGEVLELVVGSTGDISKSYGN